MKRAKWKPCKYCGREIKTTQRKCLWCGRYLHDFTAGLPKTKRNQEIIKKRNAGATLRELAIEYDLSQERIRQICRDFS